MHQLYSYLHKIRQGKPINLIAFDKLCQKNKVCYRNILRFEPSTKGKQQYRAQIIDENLFSECLQQFGDNSTRSLAARAGNSHTAKVSVSFLLLQDSLAFTPDLIWLDNTSDLPTVHHQRAVIIENLENFACWQTMQKLLQQWLPGNDWQQVDFLFGAGNQVANVLNRPFLSQYDSIFCLLDWDIGGLSIFKNLYAMLSEKLLIFALPDDPLPYLQTSVRKLRPDERSHLAEFANISAESNRLIRAMLDSGKYLEQEIFID